VPLDRIAAAALLVTLALGVLAPPAAEAQRTSSAVRIGWLGVAAPETGPHLREALRQGLRELGWVEGQNVLIEYRYAEGNLDRLPTLAAELVRLKVDVILAAVETAAIAAKRATTTIPIVMAAGGTDPVRSGLIASLGRPGGNVTGLASFAGPELSGKQLQLLKEVIPTAVRVGVLWNSSNPVTVPFWRETETAAGQLGVTLLSLDVRGPRDYEGAFSAMTTWRAAAFLALSDAVTFTYRNQIVGLAAKSRLPAMYAQREFVGAGGLMSYGASVADMFRRSATYVDKILKGAKPADLPVERPTKFELVINMTTAKALGLTIPPSVLLQADQVIE
jgi:putative ABC transport system substrate-binding protein